MGSEPAYSVDRDPASRGFSGPVTGRILPVSRRNAGGPAVRRDLVLLVDDSSVARELYGDYLRHHGYDVITAAEAMTGIRLAIEARPHLIVMDLAMPQMTGVAAAQRLKGDFRTRDIPILLLTAHALRAIAEDALENGVDAFLTKPCLHEDLQGYVRALIDRRRGSATA